MEPVRSPTTTPGDDRPGPSAAHAVTPTAVPRTPSPQRRPSHFVPQSPRLYFDPRRQTPDDQDVLSKLRVASRRLQHVMATSQAVPFPRPPEVLGDLMRRFEEGLREFVGDVGEGSKGKGAHEGARGLESIFEEMDVGDSSEDSVNKAVGDSEPSPGNVESGGDRGEQEGDSEPTDDEGFDYPVLGNVDTAEGSRVDRLLPDMVSQATMPTLVETPASPPTAHKIPAWIRYPGAPPSMPALRSMPSISNLFAARNRDRDPSGSASMPQLDAAFDYPFNSRDRQSSDSRDTELNTIVGLPPLPLSAEHLWKDLFLGNTPDLSHRLLSWHSVTSELYRKHEPSDRTMKLHPLFSYPPAKPVNIALASVSFWDTSVEPHQELRYIGPGDVASLVYGEVDTFVGTEEEGDNKSGTRVSNYERMMQMAGTAETGETKKRKYGMDTRERNERGEGRWAFIVVKGKKEDGDEEVAPWLMIAWPTSAVTRTTECLHTICTHSIPSIDTPLDELC
ncbi:hypothetical protein CC80DRAFT_173440 [Byssothecium circinans]|uniref:Uncharacterized protein n=1 Tax=Byssothecium circinans TaxID=147558 RepID=A0A6A5TJ79_9PLEO|nr:hypothetical protein CC80DRAFT_173440 [Byssothecium circinans]